MLHQELVADDQRNRRICEDVIDAVRAGRSPLVLTERNEHVDRLESGLSASVRHVVTLRAGLGKERRQLVSDRWRRFPATKSASSWPLASTLERV